MSVAGDARRLLLGVPARPAEGSHSLGRIALVAAICAIPVALYIPFLTEPLFRDEGFYAAVAQQLLDGGIPYRDAFDNKPPLVFVWYALSFAMFGENVWAPRLLVSLLLAATTLSDDCTDPLDVRVDSTVTDPDEGDGTRLEDSGSWTGADRANTGRAGRGCPPEGG